MTVRNDNHIERIIDVNKITSREELRKKILITYAIEDCETKIRYYVERLSDGNRIYIERPAPLNKGCDFVIYVENLFIWKNGNDKPPRHKDLLNDLYAKKQQLTKEQYCTLMDAIAMIYNVESYDTAIIMTQALPIIGWSYELLLKLTRWFFIEQDITYWSGEGRNMLYTAIKGI